MWQVASQSSSSPGCVWTLTQIWFDMVPEGTNRAASLPSKAATRSCRRWTVGSSSKTSSATSAAWMAARMAAVGRVTVSLRRSIRESADMAILIGSQGLEVRSQSPSASEGVADSLAGARALTSDPLLVAVLQIPTILDLLQKDLARRQQFQGSGGAALSGGPLAVLGEAAEFAHLGRIVAKVLVGRLHQTLEGERGLGVVRQAGRHLRLEDFQLRLHERRVGEVRQQVIHAPIRQRLDDGVEGLLRSFLRVFVEIRLNVEVHDRLALAGGLGGRAGQHGQAEQGSAQDTHAKPPGCT